MSFPEVSVVIPVRNEADNIDACLAAADRQDYDGSIEVIVVDGGSTDSTRHHVQGRATVLANPKRLQAAGMNIGIAQATGEVIVRLDARTRMREDYVRACVEELQYTGAAMVGGAMVPEADAELLPRTLALVMSTPLALGGARFRSQSHGSAWVHSVYLGAFPRAMALEAGGYEESWETNEDAEFAHRMKAHGGVWMSDRIVSTYRVRNRFQPVMRQFFRYGEGRAKTIKRHPSSIRLRHILVPALSLAAVTKYRKLALSAYGGGVLGVAAYNLNRDTRAAMALPFLLPTIHGAWALGLIRGFFAAGGVEKT